jgi:hypothetical protein
VVGGRIGEIGEMGVVELRVLRMGLGLVPVPLEDRVGVSGGVGS